MGGVGGSFRLLTTAPGIEEALCQTLKLIVRTWIGPATLTLIVFQHTASGGAAREFEDIAHENGPVPGKSRGEAHGIGNTVFGKARTGGVSEIAVVAKLLFSGGREHLTWGSADAAEASGQGQTVRKGECIFQTFGRNKKWTSHGGMRLIVTAAPVHIGGVISRTNRGEDGWIA